ncbi:MAG TPA: aminotransferase class V-fold PLP-dependent enzyme, partial [Rubrobacter sp.]|nr:aminotransferase class V-fold PLP-dependent enzyme [Rubrobacter sp.]
MFPALATNDCAYLNTGSSGPPPDYVLKAIREADDLCSGPAYLEGFGLFVHQAEMNSRARDAAARLVGADEVALTQNTTHGMNLGVGAIDWRAGDKVVSVTTEHPGCLVPLHNLKNRFGVEI